MSRNHVTSSLTIAVEHQYAKGFSHVTLSGQQPANGGVLITPATAMCRRASSFLRSV